VLLGASIARAADDPNTFLTPEAAGPDFAVQGEYTGEVPGEQGMHKLGVQIIALGNGKFRAVGCPGGLPGDGWDKEERLQVDGETVGGITSFVVADKGSGKITNGNGVLELFDSGGQRIGELKRVDRQSPTLGTPPPKEGAVVLFDGTTADHFEGGRLTEDGLLMQGVTSKHKFQSCTLHLEFRTPFQPLATGQGRGNSGCYLQGRYEVQVLDSFGLEGLHNECGGIYEVRNPDVNMCFPPLSWQTYDIDYTAARFDADGKKVANARITVQHNGVVIHNNVEIVREGLDLMGGTRGAPIPEGPEPGPLYLQDHTNPVYYRNIWLVEKE
jgi:hypothetical protein